MRYLLDYDEDEVEPNSKLSFAGVKKYWMKRKGEESGLEYQWSAKDQTLLSRTLKEYSSSDVVTMIDHHLMFKPTSTFGEFFKNRENIYIKEVKDKDYGW